MSVKRSVTQTSTLDNGVVLPKVSLIDIIGGMLLITMICLRGGEFEGV
jgi:hypothetical protein